MTKLTKLSRSKFLRLMAASLGAVAGGRLLGACRPSTPTAALTIPPDEPEATRLPAATAAEPTRTTLAQPTASATSQSTPVPAQLTTTAPEPTLTLVPGGVRRPEVIKFFPDTASQLVRVHHSGAWAGVQLVPEALRQMLDAGITRLTGLNDARQAWGALFSPTERIAIKINTIMSSSYWTPVPLVMAVAQSLKDAGIPAEQIVIFDRNASELRNAGFTINPEGAGVRCTSTTTYAKGYKLAGQSVGLSETLLSCDALINMPILKSHGNAGMTFAMKNHYGTFDRPTNFYHSGIGIQQGIAELNALPDIKNRTRLIVGSLLNFIGASSWGWTDALPGDSLLFSFDPVATDAYAMQEFQKVVTSGGPSPKTVAALATPWIKFAAGLGVGTNDPGNWKVDEMSL